MLGEIDLRQKLKKLPRHVGGTNLRQAVRSGARIIRKAAQSRVKRKSGALARSLTEIVKEDRAGNVRGQVGARMPDGAHIHLVELGTRTRTTGSGASRGFAPAQPFLRPAFDSNKDAAIREIGRVLKTKIQQLTR
jgi:HK97 gp10 family phage protein